MLFSKMTEVELIGGPLDGAKLAVAKDVVHNLSIKNRFVHVFDTSRQHDPEKCGPAPQLLYRMEEGSATKALFVRVIIPSAE